MIEVIRGLRGVFDGERFLEGMDVAIENGRVVEVGRNLKGDREVICEDKVLYPAFVDSHTHLIYSGNRLDEFLMRLKGEDYVEILKRGGGINSTVRRTKLSSDEELLNDTRRRLEILKRFGVRAVEIKTGYGIEFEEEIRLLRLINTLAKEYSDMIIVPTLLFHLRPKDIEPFFERFEEYRGFLKFVDIFADEGAFNYEEAERILKFFTERGIRCRLHADEFKPFGSILAGRYRCISADHLLNPSEDGLKLMAENGVIATLCPTTGFFLGKGFAPYRKIRSFGIEVALASDHNPGTSPNLNPFITILLAIHGYRMLPSEAFRSHTYIAAKSLGIHDLGKVEKGYRAYFFAIDHTPEELAYNFQVPLEIWHYQP